MKMKPMSKHWVDKIQQDNLLEKKTFFREQFQFIVNVTRKLQVQCGEGNGFSKTQVKG